LNAIITFVEGKYPISFGGNNYYYKDLDKNAQTVIYSLQIVGDVAYEYTEDYKELIADEDKIAWFEMINYGRCTPPDAKHLQWLKEKV
jgi:hypothetical protein